MSQQRPDKEKLHFKIGLSGTYWSKQPAYSIRLNGFEYLAGHASNDIQYVEFSEEVEEGTECVLEIRLNNKTDADVVQNEDKTEIVKDMLLNIESIEIDEIDLDQLIWSASEFVGDDPKRPTLKGCINLGWNGAYTLKFTSPFYLWLLASM